MLKRLYKLPSIIIFSLSVAIIMVVTRLIISDINLHIFSIDALIFIIANIANEFTILVAIVCSISFVFSKNKIFLITAIISYVLIELVCFHYERMFGRFPSIDLVFYFTQLSHLSSSLNAEVPAYKLFIEFIVIFAFIFAIYWKVFLNERISKASQISRYLFVILMFVSILFQVFPSVIPQKYFWHTRHSIVWLIQSNFIKEKYNIEALSLSENDFKQFMLSHGHREPLLISDPAYPVCMTPKRHEKAEEIKNIIILLLEGVGNREAQMKYSNHELMPNLQLIIDENLSFNNIIAPGTKSIQTLPALFSGLPAHPFSNYLWSAPLINLKGFPSVLSEEEGYSTAYFHGSDLSFEHQKWYLNSVGFEEVYDFDHTKDIPVYGWGYDDEIMFQQLVTWIENHKQSTPEKPYLATLATLSSHHPFILPTEWEPLFLNENKKLENNLDWWGKDNGSETEFGNEWAESYRYLDHYLGKFYNWFKNNSENTILIITGDHSFNYFAENNSNSDLRFDVPLIIAGLDDDIEDNYLQYVDRAGGSHDIPASIMSLLGKDTHDCNLGMNLFMDDKLWPMERFIYAVSGDASEKIHIWQNDLVYIYDRIRDDIYLPTVDTPDNIRINIREFIDNLLKVHFYLFKKDAYFKTVQQLTEPVISKNKDTNTVYVSHRANLNGPSSNPSFENSEIGLKRVLESGVHWVEVDVQLTRDGIPVLIHDPDIISNDKKLLISGLSLSELRELEGYSDVLTLENAIQKYADKLNFLIEVKPRENFSTELHITKEVSRIVREKPGEKQIIVDSFDLQLISSIKNQCECQVAYDTPFKVKIDEKSIRGFKSLGIDWIYVHYSVVDADLIYNANKYKMKVMAYTVNSSDIIDEWINLGIMPDGIITDYHTIIPGPD